MRGPKTLLILTVLWAALGASFDSHAASEDLKMAERLYREGQYFKAARYAFQAAEGSNAGQAYALASTALTDAGLYHSASYFFIRALQSGDRDAMRSALRRTQQIMVHVGADFLRNFLTRYTRLEDYDSENKSAFLYTLGKEALLSGDERKAIGHLDGISPRAALRPFALQLRGAAYAILGNVPAATRDFEECVDDADSAIGRVERPNDRLSRAWANDWKAQLEDLQARCLAGKARAYYQVNQFDEADQTYDRIPKASFVWTDILFEQAWNAYSQKEYNRTLGKLVSYKSPDLGFVFNSEVDVLNAQAYLALCLYSDANEVINAFNAKYSRITREVKEFVDQSGNNLSRYYEKGKQAYQAPLHSRNEFNRLLNRFVRSPYFTTLVRGERSIEREKGAIMRFDALQPGVSHNPMGGFPGFLRVVLAWRTKAVQLFGGAFVKNSLLDYHQVLLADFDRMAFIKLEMLSRAKDRLIYKKASPRERSRGNVMPARRDHQYRWTFNGEFWNDEIGDYVFGLESECEGK